MQSSQGKNEKFPILIPLTLFSSCFVFVSFLSFIPPPQPPLYFLETFLRFWVLQAYNVDISITCYSIAETKTNNKRNRRPRSNSESEQGSQGRREAAV